LKAINPTRQAHHPREGLGISDWNSTLLLTSQRQPSDESVGNLLLWLQGKIMF
jgi:hypothetical protein